MRSTRLPAPMLIALVALFWTSTALAQFNPIPGTPFNAAITRNITYESCPNPTILTAQADDAVFNVSLPFPFKYYDTMENNASISSNGAMGLPQSNLSQFTWSSNDPPGSTSTPDGVIAAWWDDNEFFGGSNGYVGYSTIGTAPTRIFCVEWKNMSKDNFRTSSDHRINTRVLLHEGLAGRIDIEYGVTSGTPQTTVSASIGIEDQNGGRGITWGPPGSSCGANFNQCREDVLAGLNNTRITFIQDAGQEVVALGANAPQFGFLDTAFDLPVAFQSLHGNPLGPFQVTVYAADNAAMANKVSVGTAQASLTSFQLSQLMVPVTVPSALGPTSVWFELEVDSSNVIMETNEINNSAVSASSTRFLAAGPDLTVDRVATDVTEALAGGTVTVYTRVSNVGGVTVTGGDVAVMLSTNPAIGSQDVQLGAFNVTLAPGETVNSTTTVTIPSGANSGAYYLGAVADPAGSLDELNESNNGRAALETIAISGAGLSVTTTALPRGFLFEPYTGLLIASGGTLPYTWEITSGMLPDGLGFVPATGEIFGRPSMEQTSNFSVKVTSGDGQEATQDLSVTIGSPDEPLTIVSRAVAAAVVGQEYAFQLVVTGGSSTSSLTWSLSDGPEGFSITQTGVLVGSPVEAGTFDITVTVSDGTDTASQQLTLEVKENATLLIVPKVLSTATFGQAYSEQLEATGGNPPVTWLIQLGSLPAGMNLSPTGEISGTPTQVGEFRLVIEARDSAPGSVAAKDVNTFVLTVVDTEGFEILTDTLGDGVIEQGYDESIAANGGLPPYEWTIIEGRLPEGLLGSSDPNTNEFRIAGQPSESGVTSLLVRARDAQGRTTQRAFSLVVLEAAIVDPGPNAGGEEDGGCVCVQPNRPSSAWALVGFVVVFGLARRRRC